jgi:hypothetical protein
VALWQAGERDRVRATIDAHDLLRLAHGIAIAAAGSAGTASRLVDVVMDGLRA